MIPSLPDSLKDIQEDPRKMRDATRCINSVQRYNPQAGSMVRYLGEFITLKCAPDMLAMKLFPNAKEISESFAAFEAVRRHLQELHLGDPHITMIAVGDGGTPRTAATFAFRSNWICHSIDPNLKGGKLRWNNIARLTLHPDKARYVEPIKCPSTAVVVAVHSHADLREAILVANAPRIVVISIPCCVPQKLSVPPDKRYVDKAIISPKNEVLIWKDVTGVQEFTQPALFEMRKNIHGAN